ncbi:RICIN domain-containing protein [Dactylosporangium cerinum]
MAAAGDTWINPQSGKCLDAAGAGTANGTLVQLWTCLNNSAQQWVPRADGTFLNPASGKCLDATAWGTGNGTRLQLWTCGTGQSNQNWRLA